MTAGSNGMTAKFGGMTAGIRMMTAKFAVGTLGLGSSPVAVGVGDNRDGRIDGDVEMTRFANTR